LKKGVLITVVIVAALLMIGVGYFAFVLGRKAEGSPAIVCEKQGAWTLIGVSPEQQDLPAPRWARPLPGGHLVAQFAWPQGQWMALFQDGALQELIEIPCPATLDKAFFKTAELVDAQLRPKEVLVLLLASPKHDGKELPVVLALDLKSKAIRWFHRAAGRNLALAPKDPSVFLSGGDGAIYRLPLAGKDGLALQGAEAIPMPAEVPNVASLLPVSAKAFLVAHTKGLSAHLENGSWLHHPLPKVETAVPLKFPETLNTLTKTSSGILWQPRPGQLFQVQSDGQIAKAVDRAPFACEESHAKDAQLLNLLGKDSQGRLWFGLTVPVLEEQAAILSVDTKVDESEGWTSEEAAAPAAPVFTAEDRTQWQEYLKAPMDRIYTWDPASGRFMFLVLSQDWARLSAPPGLQAPQSDAAFHPYGDALLLPLGENRVAYLPFKALSLRLPAQAK